MRLYIPSTSTLIERLVIDGSIQVDQGFAVTPALREWYVADDEEELEYLASQAAAKESLAKLAQDPKARRRRAVLALDVPSITPAIDGKGDRAEVSISFLLTFANVDSALIDSVEAQDDVAAALAVWDRLDEDAHFAREQALSHELLWFARQELPFIF